MSLSDMYGYYVAGQTFMAADSTLDHDSTFNGSISFRVNCESRDEGDHYREALSENPTVEQRGWLKDEFGVSWQIVLATTISD